MRRIIGFVCLTSLAGVAAFTGSTTPAHSRLATTLAAGPGDAELMSALVVAASAAAAYQEYRTDKFDAVKKIGEMQREALNEKIESIQNDLAFIQEEIDKEMNKGEANGVVVADSVEPVPVQEETVVVASSAATVEEAAPVVVIKEETPVAATKPKPISLKKTSVVPSSSPKPVAATMTTTEEPRTASDSLTDLVKQVGKTVEQNKEMEDRIKSRREKEAAEAAKEQAATATEEEEEETKPKRGIIRKAWRVTKKVVAPWRKWQNIS